MTLDFNKIYVIQSLDRTREKETGKILYEEVIQYFSLRHPNIENQFFDVQTVEQFKKILLDIAVQCHKGVKPIVHFELHGSIFGFALVEGFLEWGEVYKCLIPINIASRFNLFITTAVCFSNYSMAMLLPTLPAAFKGSLGSFEVMYENDIYIQYTAFYTELLNTLDFEQALLQFYVSNPSISHSYKVLDAEEIFKNIYQKFINDNSSKNTLKNRFENELQRRGIYLDFEKKESEFLKFMKLAEDTQKPNFYKYREIFFMYSSIPENRDKYCADWQPDYFTYS